MTNPLQWLYSLLEGNYLAFNPEDQELIKEYWNIVFNSLLDYHQQDLERQLDLTLFDALPTKKRLWHGLKTGYEWELYNVASIPYRMPNGISEFKAYGAKTRTEATVTLPIDLGDEVEIFSVSSSNAFTRDGAKILGTGTADVIYDTSYISDAEVTGGFLTTSGVTSILCLRTPYNELTYSGTAEVLVGGTLYDVDTDFSGLTVGTKFSIGATDLYLTSIVDKNTIALSATLAHVGRKLFYSHNGFGYVTLTDAISIPEFDNGWLENVNYYIDDGKLAFASLPPETLIAERIHFDNDNIQDLFGKYIGIIRASSESAQNYLDRVCASWYGIFAGANAETMAVTAHILMGLPFVSYPIGNLAMKSIVSSISEPKDWILMTPGDHGVLTTSVNYFEEQDYYIHWENGAFSKVVQKKDNSSVFIDGYMPTTAINGRCCTADIDYVLCTDVYGIDQKYGIPSGCVPNFAPGDAMPIWSRVCSGVRVYDIHGRGEDLNESGIYDPAIVWDHTSFIESGAALGSLSTQRLRARCLRANTFVIEFDMDRIDDFSFLDSLKPAQSMYSTRLRANTCVIWEDILVTT